MSWLLNLYETYQLNEDQVGNIRKRQNGQEYTLLPISHTTQNAHIEVQITETGGFHSAEIIDKQDASTLIPCTEDAANRAGSKIAPYPLHDKLSYVAGDFVAYGGKIKKEEPFTYYIKQLKEWTESSYATDEVKSIYIYLSKRRLIKDLVGDRKLFLDAHGQLIGTWDKKKYDILYGDKPLIFSTVTGGQESAFIRFNVRSHQETKKAVWKDKAIYESFIQYYRYLLGEQDICYVTGENLPSTDKHSNKIRNAADKAKLISANDSSGFTFRGRFDKGNEAANISYEVSQKAHNALKWLINRQGKTIDNRVFLVWGNESTEIVDPIQDAFDVLSKTQTNQQQERSSFTNEEYANEVAKALDGYKSNLSSKANVNILVLDSATTGRLAVLYYRNMNIEDYIDGLKKWHATCAWSHRYRKNDKGKQTQFFGSPATKDIAFAAYGPKANEKVVKGLMERMLPCIIDGRKIPLDIVRSAIQRASYPVSMEEWEWEKTLSITCSLINKQEGYKVALDIEINDRSYLFGRLLAVADVLERRALDKEDTRSSNATRYMNSFSRYPERTWKTIYASLLPYQARLGKRANDLSDVMDEVLSKFKFDEFNNEPLSGKYLLGFGSQRHELFKKKKKDTNINENKQ
ncbi:type I-C CRISPR-associated protein Cas8c/Csd1 [Chengkuizengella sediminis]|uniref:type I-C CRISPR-associated protein Cas8c/Csd1 n=1 Tax=Chengkuizengella sediminis TaxID=1885917 RepID=UPI001389F2F2|nr:type I-C CRISPR-associated protein Cas8c/Csd1 [Chengkuizengella sediminis]NDI36006.1 type I-C CRISPR-associated protein Cas8c/Csd1 [Chengkuizengella sediminis]